MLPVSGPPSLVNSTTTLSASSAKTVRDSPTRPSSLTIPATPLRRSTTRALPQTLGVLVTHSSSGSHLAMASSRHKRRSSNATSSPSLTSPSRAWCALRPFHPHRSNLKSFHLDGDYLCVWRYFLRQDPYHARQRRATRYHPPSCPGMSSVWHSTLRISTYRPRKSSTALSPNTSAPLLQLRTWRSTRTRSTTYSVTENP